MTVNWENNREGIIRLLEDDAKAWVDAAERLESFREFLTGLKGSQLDSEIEQYHARADALRRAVRRMTQLQP
jgi:hypothetical protein